MSFSAFTAINCLNTINMMNTTAMMSRTMMQSSAAAVARRNTAAYLARRQSPNLPHDRQQEEGLRPYMHLAERLEVERQREFREQFHRKIREQIMQSVKETSDSQDAEHTEVKPETVGPFTLLPPEPPKRLIDRVVGFLFH